MRPAPASAAPDSALRSAQLALPFLLGLGLCACAPAEVPSAPPKPPVIAAAPRPAAPEPVALPEPAEPSEPPVPLPPRIERPAEVACTWTSDRWLTSSAVELRMRPGGPSFARASGGPRAHVQIPVGPAKHGIADASSGGLLLTGIVDASSIVLHPAHAFPMNGVVYPTSAVSLTWTKGQSGRVTVTAPAPTQLLLSRLPLAGTPECASVTLDRGARMDMYQEIFGAPSGSPCYFPSARMIAISSDPARPAEVKLFSSDLLVCDAFAQKDGFTRIAVDVDQVFVAGWVRSSLVQGSSGRGSTGGIGFGYAGIADPARSPLAKVVCPDSVPLVAEVAGETATVGAALPGTTIEILERRGPFSRVFVTSRGVHMLGTAAFLARASDLETCSLLRN